MEKTKLIIMLSVFVIGIVVYGFISNQSSVVNKIVQEGDATMQDTGVVNLEQPDSETVMMDDQVLDDNEKAMENDQLIEEKSGQYLDYNEGIIAETTKNGGKALLFFHASWCPTCIASDKEISENLDKIPNNVTVIKTDYDSEKELKNKYDVTYQHTFVQVEENGEMVTSWNGGGINEIISRVK